MAKINILDSSVFNLISAGEVVEKPMSVVKELIENSIDAGAGKIEVEVKRGGIDYIRVTDDGCGIERSEIHKAFLPHATSKIADVSDLNSIFTLGFRGEALASIAAVAKVTMTTRTEGEEFGYTVIYEAGKVVSEYECGAKKGTSVVVENLFEKIPARQKYLRNPSSEEADIANLITRLILANPKVAFEFTGSSKKIASTGENEKSALIAVYGNDVLPNYEEVSLVMPDITIHGFIGKPSFSKHSRNYQTLVVNGRYVINEDLFYMIYLCYKDFLMTRKYPTFVLYIDLPADMVDVNVHPSKMEVKFVQPDRIKKLVRSLINAKLNNVVLTPKALDEVSDKSSTSRDLQRESVSTVTERIIEPERKADYGDFSVGSIKLSPTDIVGVKSTMKEKVAHASLPSGSEGYFGGTVYNFLGDDQDISKSKEVESSSFLGEEDLLTVGTLFSTYIIVEKGENCYIIDQHAAHERILYDNLVKRTDEKTAIQPLLFPYSFSLTHEESEIMDQSAAIFDSCGFKIVKEGDCRYAITAVPTVFADMSLSKFLPIFFDAVKTNELKQSELIKDALAQSACKAAVKGDRLLSQDEIDYLIKGMSTLDALLCPHGRPIVVKISKLEMDKWFKRK